MTNALQKLKFGPRNEEISGRSDVELSIRTPPLTPDYTGEIIYGANIPNVWSRKTSKTSSSWG